MKPRFGSDRNLCTFSISDILLGQTAYELACAGKEMGMARHGAVLAGGCGICPLLGGHSPMSPAAKFKKLRKKPVGGKLG
jgi:hypothetical protein